MPIVILFALAVPTLPPIGEPPPPLHELPDPDRVTDPDDIGPYAAPPVTGAKPVTDGKDIDFVLHEGKSGPAGGPVAVLATTLGATLPALLAAGGLIAATAIGAVTLAGTGAPVIALLVGVGFGFLAVPILIGAGSGAGLLMAAVDDTADDWASLARLLGIVVAVGVTIAAAVALAGALVVGVAMTGSAGAGIINPLAHGCGQGCSPGPIPRDIDVAPEDSDTNGARNFAVLTPMAFSAGGAVVGGAAGLGAYTMMAGDQPLDPTWVPIATAVGSGIGLVAGAGIGGALGGAAAVMSVE